MILVKKNTKACNHTPGFTPFYGTFQKFTEDLRACCSVLYAIHCKAAGQQSPECARLHTTAD